MWGTGGGFRGEVCRRGGRAVGVQHASERIIVNKFIAYCGLDCGTCEARVATERDDEALKEQVAKKWSELNGVEITPAMIHCDGCRVEGRKTPYCGSLCPIRQCALQKKVETCGEMSGCGKVGAIWKNNAAARRNLESGR